MAGPIVLADPGRLGSGLGQTLGWERLRLTWTGWDGSVWDLTDPSGGVFLVPEGVEGLGLPEYTDWDQDSPAIPGQWHRGEIANRRRVFWPLVVFTAGAGKFRDLDSRFFRSLRRGKVGLWEATTPGVGGSTRRLECRVRSVPDSINRDPFRTGWNPYGVELVADQPYWMGQDVSRQWGLASNSQFFSGPLLTIGSGYGFDTAKISNPGDVEVWPRWEVEGPIPWANLGVGNATISLPFGITENQVLRINTNPQYQTVELWERQPGGPLGYVDDWTDRLGDSTRFEQQIAAGADQQLTIQVGAGAGEYAGRGIVRMSITPLYERAW